MLPVLSADKSALERAAAALHAHKLVVVPTETVYGLAANALSAEAVTSIFTTKRRPVDNPLIVHVSNTSMLDSLTPSPRPAVYSALMDKFWPGPLTLLFPASPHLPTQVTAGLDTVAVRMPSHPIACALISTADIPLAAPSANLSGLPSPTTPLHAATDLAKSSDTVDCVLDGGPCNFGIESTVVDGISQPGVLKILRPGAISLDDLKSVCSSFNVKVRSLHHHETSVQVAQPSTPGMKYRHYSPSSAIVYLLDISSSSSSSSSLQDFISTLQQSSNPAARIGIMLTDDSPLQQHVQKLKTETEKYNKLACSFEFYSLGRSTRPVEAARNLFAGLRHLDKLPCSVILLEKVDQAGIGTAVVERSLKAASNNVVEISI